MFIETARQWIEELRRADKLGDRSPRDLEDLAEEFARRLEDFFNGEVSRQLEACGKAADYERMLLYDGQYIHKYLNQSIPGYPAFRQEVLGKAKEKILGDFER